MVLICREINSSTGEIAVYEVSDNADNKLIFRLSLRARLNPELTYYAIPNIFYETQKADIFKYLKRRKLTDKKLKEYELVKL